MDKTLTLTIDPAEAADEVLAAVRRVAGVRDADLINPRAKSAVARSMAFAVLSDDADLRQACRAVARVRGVKDCSIPPERFAM